MNYPLISEYIEAIKSAEDNFEELSYLRPVLGDDGLPVMTSGNFAVVFKMKDVQSGKFYAVKCFTKEQEGRAEAYREISLELGKVSSPYFLSIRYLDKELFVDTKQTTETEFPVLLMDWVEGKTLDKYLRENIDDKYALEMLAYRFSQLAQWLIPQPFAHGDLKPDNILVRFDGSLVLVDYDGMYVPAMKAQKARELGSPDFRHPQRTENDFDEHIDDFPFILILLSLKVVSLNQKLLCKCDSSDKLLLAENDFLDLRNSNTFLSLLNYLYDREFSLLFSSFIEVLSGKKAPITSYNKLIICPPFDRKMYSFTENELMIGKKDEESVVYSSDGLRVLTVLGYYLSNYKIKEGTTIICNYAFNDLDWEDEDYHEDVLDSGEVIPFGLLVEGYISIPSSVQHIGMNPFCGNLDSIICESLFFVVENSALYTKDKRRLITCFCNSEEFVIPSGVESIDDYAFYQCSIKRIIIPDSVLTIGMNPFAGMNSKELIVICKSPYFTVIDNTLYSNNSKELISFWGDEKDLHILSGTKSIRLKSIYGRFLNSIHFPNSIICVDGMILGKYRVAAKVFVPCGSINKYKEVLPDYDYCLIEE